MSKEIVPKPGEFETERETSFSLTPQLDQLKDITGSPMGLDLARSIVFDSPTKIVVFSGEPGTGKSTLRNQLFTGINEEILFWRDHGYPWLPSIFVSTIIFDEARLSLVEEHGETNEWKGEKAWLWEKREEILTQKILSEIESIRVQNDVVQEVLPGQLIRYRKLLLVELPAVGTDYTGQLTLDHLLQQAGLKNQGRYISSEALFIRLIPDPRTQTRAKRFRTIVKETPSEQRYKLREILKNEGFVIVGDYGTPEETGELIYTNVLAAASPEDIDMIHQQEVEKARAWDVQYKEKKVLRRVKKKRDIYISSGMREYYKKHRDEKQDLEDTLLLAQYYDYHNMKDGVLRPFQKVVINEESDGPVYIQLDKFARRPKAQSRY
jgi:hypothetical protein